MIIYERVSCQHLEYIYNILESWIYRHEEKRLKKDHSIVVRVLLFNTSYVCDGGGRSVHNWRRSEDRYHLTFLIYPTNRKSPKHFVLYIKIFDILSGTKDTLRQYPISAKYRFHLWHYYMCIGRES